jgi:hypothetical protein
MKRIIVLFLVLLVLVGCSTSYGQTEEELPTGCPGDCSGGSGGIDVLILTPYEDASSEANVFYDFEPLEPSVKISNTGEADSELDVCISFRDQDLVSGECDCLSYDVVVNYPDDPYYEVAYVDFGYYNFDSDEVSRDSYMSVYTTYRYQTYGDFTAFIKDKAEGVLEDDILDKSSSAPVKITGIKEILSPRGSSADLTFVVDVKVNEDDNEWLFSAEDLGEGCEIPDYLYEPIIKASVYLDFFGREVTCPDIKIEDGKGSTTCKMDVSLTASDGTHISDYDAIGYVKLDYGFRVINGVGFNVIRG